MIFLIKHSNMKSRLPTIIELLGKLRHNQDHKAGEVEANSDYFNAVRYSQAKGEKTVGPERQARTYFYGEFK